MKTLEIEFFCYSFLLLTSKIIKNNMQDAVRYEILFIIFCFDYFKTLLFEFKK